MNSFRSCIIAARTDLSGVITYRNSDLDEPAGILALGETRVCRTPAKPRAAHSNRTRSFRCGGVFPARRRFVVRLPLIRRDSPRLKRGRAAWEGDEDERRKMSAFDQSGHSECAQPSPFLSAPPPNRAACSTVQLDCRSGVWLTRACLGDVHGPGGTYASSRQGHQVDRRCGLKRTFTLRDS